MGVALCRTSNVVFLKHSEYGSVISSCSQISWDLEGGLARGIQTVPCRFEFSAWSQSPPMWFLILRWLLQFGSHWTEVESSQWIRMRIGDSWYYCSLFFRKWQHGWGNAAATFVMNGILCSFNPFFQEEQWMLPAILHWRLSSPCSSSVKEKMDIYP